MFPNNHLINMTQKSEKSRSAAGIIQISVSQGTSGNFESDL